ncbi:hypothetical protein B9J93_16675 [Vibrio sp. V17_P4S1T151]|uniref:hypothetical protein n=1 Tax=unclassified Vibrio TaxID=2614977 RepID=UPI000B8E7646|nr:MULTISPECIES: hypothetical protein [unclassified Vibrio]OXX42959.1 hypothetical protein B9J93_16675 [Vibrio sp. V17_P4S1T151]OXX65091.1 hypothetical protein B9J89_04190 [Vibrio sp. V15_P4S5T153]
MKFIAAHTAIISQAEEGKPFSFFYLQAVEVDDIHFEQIKAELGFDDMDDDEDTPMCMADLPNCNSFNMHSIKGFINPITPDCKPLHELHPNLKCSSTMSDFVIPYVEGLKLGEWLGFVHELSRELSEKFCEYPGVDGFISYLSERDVKNLSDLESNLIEGKFTVKFSEQSITPSLIIESWDFKKIGGLDVKQAERLQGAFDRYCRAVSNDNYSATQTVQYAQAQAELLSLKGCKPESW